MGGCEYEQDWWAIYMSNMNGMSDALDFKGSQERERMGHHRKPATFRAKRSNRHSNRTTR